MRYRTKTNSTKFVSGCSKCPISDHSPALRECSAGRCKSSTTSLDPSGDPPPHDGAWNHQMTLELWHRGYKHFAFSSLHFVIFWGLVPVANLAQKIMGLSMSTDKLEPLVS